MLRWKSHYGFRLGHEMSRVCSKLNERNEGIRYSSEKEYDYAAQQGVPAMGFVHADPDAIPISEPDLADDARKKLDAFREKVMAKTVKPYSSAEDLGSKVARGLIHLRRPTRCLDGCEETRQ